MVWMGRNSADGLFGVQLAQRVENARGETRWRHAGADDQLRALRALLRDRVVDLRAGSALDSFFVNIVDDADDVIFFFAAHEDLADRVFPGPVEHEPQMR